MKLLQAVLELGNHLNAGTHRGCAAGFKLDTLLKLSDIKATDKKTSLLQFVIQQLLKQDPTIDRLTHSMAHVKPASTLQLSAIAAMLQEIKLGLNSIKKEIDVAKANLDSHKGAQRYIQSMEPFIEETMKVFAALEQDRLLALTELQETTEYYGEDFSPKDPTRVVKVVKEFLFLFSKSLNDIRSKEEKENATKKKGIIHQQVEKASKESLSPAKVNIVC